MAAPVTRGRLAYRPAELAELVGLSPKAIYRAISRGELQAAKIANGSRILIPAEAAAAWLMENAMAPKSAPSSRGRRSSGSARQPLRAAFTRLDGKSGED